MFVPRQVVATDRAPASPVYSQAVVAGNLVVVSGTVGRNMATGTWPETIEAQAEQALANLSAVLEEAGCGLDDVVKVTIFITALEHGQQIAEIYRRALPAPPPARSAIAVLGPADSRSAYLHRGNSAQAGLNTDQMVTEPRRPITPFSADLMRSGPA